VIVRRKENAMPSLQLDAPAIYDTATKRLLAKRFGVVYSRVMGTGPDTVTVAIRDLGEGGVWRCGEHEPQPHALLMCDVRHGRSTQTAPSLPVN
jgi:phenylpyruvate tautomerase PptA (4-oxalocrotonate tautomerase family)